MAEIAFFISSSPPFLGLIISFPFKRIIDIYLEKIKYFLFKLDNPSQLLRYFQPEARLLLLSFLTLTQGREKGKGD
jgi:hypothetical protein